MFFFQVFVGRTEFEEDEGRPSRGCRRDQREEPGAVGPNRSTDLHCGTSLSPPARLAFFFRTERKKETKLLLAFNYAWTKQLNVFFFPFSCEIC
jgi:hypothetical protein